MYNDIVRQKYKNIEILDFKNLLKSEIRLFKRRNFLAWTFRYSGWKWNYRIYCHNRFHKSLEVSDFKHLQTF